MIEFGILAKVVKFMSVFKVEFNSVMSEDFLVETGLR